MYKLEFTLKQHTPLIHFQHDQAGATLRATEVKPKLDKFLITILGEGNFDTGKTIAKEKNWFVGNGEHLALDYKIKFTDARRYEKDVYMAFSSNEDSISQQIIQNAPDITKIISNTPNFSDAQYLKKSNKELDMHRSNLGSIRRGILFKQPLVNNQIISYKQDLINTIKLNLQEFFLLNNFGYRQSKGFGSFTTTKINDAYLANDLDFLKRNFVTHRIRMSNLAEAFSTVQEIHRILKSGINLRNKYGIQKKYQKAEIFYEFAYKEVRWEKRYIKKQINNNKIDEKSLLYIDYEPTDFAFNGDDLFEENTFQDLASNTYPYKYVRALLGLADHYEFLIDNNGLQDNKVKYFVSIANDTPDEKHKIERFQSPILYKIIENNIYLIPKEIPDYLWDKLFQFTYKLKFSNGSESKEIMMTDKLPVPSKEEFDLKSFLKISLDNILTNCNI